MKSMKNFYALCLVIGLIITGIGIFLKISNSVTSGNTYGRVGNVNYNSIEGFGTIGLGIFFIFFSFWVKKLYKKEKNKFETMKRNEE